MILVAENGTDYQIIGEVISEDEARECIDSYVANGPDNDDLAPERFVLHRRADNGSYTVRVVLE